MANPFKLIDDQLAVIEPKEKKKRRVKLQPEEDYTLAEIYPRMIVSKDTTKYLVTRQIKHLIGDRSAPKKTWVKALILLKLNGSGEICISAERWRDEGWTVLDLPF
jgi:hypothetical protein